MTPDIEKNLTQEVLGKRLIADKPKKPAVDVGPMPGEQSLHCWFATSGDLFNQDLVGRSFPSSACKRRHCGDGRQLRPNRRVKHERFPSITFPAETMLETGMRFLFLRAAAAKYRFCSCFSRQCKGRGI
jgi:hypothetical protein